MRAPRQLLRFSPPALILAGALAVLSFPGTGKAQTDRAPVVTAPVKVDAAENTLLTILVTAADPDGDAIASFTAAGTAVTAGGTFTSNAANTSGTFNWTPSFTQSGTYSVTFTASNALSGSATTIIATAGPDRVPVVTAPATQTVNEGALLRFTVSAADPNGEAIASLTASSSPATTGSTFTVGAGNTSGTFNWTPSVSQSGTYNVTFTASNALSGSAITNITVTPAGDRAPVVAAPATITGQPNTLLSFTVSAADPDGDAIDALSAAPIPAGATFTANAANTSGTFTWTPTNAQSGVFNIVFTATNALSGSATTSITTCACARTPVVTAPSTVASPDLSPIVFSVTAVDPDGDAITSLTASGTAITAGGSFTTNATNTSGTFSWTPTSSQVGTYQVTFTAANDLAGTATTRITVGSPAAPARAFTLGSNKTIRLNSSKRLWCAFVEPVGGSFSLLDIDVTSIVLRSTGTGSVSEIPAYMAKSLVMGDADKNQIEDAEFCFTKGNLRLLFSNVNGRVTVDATIAGRLMDSTPFSAPVTIDVIGGGGSLAATISPNPLNPTGTISFSTPTAGLARVHIFDASGRLVRTLAERSLPAGRHDLPLDVRDVTGRRPASGVYFYRVEVAGEVATGHFVVTR